MNLLGAKRIRVHIAEFVIQSHMMKCVRSGDQSTSEEFVSLPYEINHVEYNSEQHQVVSYRYRIQHREGF